MAIAKQDPSLLHVQKQDAKAYVPPWYRPGYPQAFRGAAWKRLRPAFRDFLWRKVSRGDLLVYRPSPQWTAKEVGERKGTSQIFQQAPESLPDEGEFVLFDPEPISALESNTTFSEKIADRPILYGSIALFALVFLFPRSHLQVQRK